MAKPTLPRNRWPLVWVRLHPDVRLRLKMLAKATGESMTRLHEAALRDYLEREAARIRRES